MVCYLASHDPYKQSLGELPQNPIVAYQVLWFLVIFITWSSNCAGMAMCFSFRVILELSPIMVIYTI